MKKTLILTAIGVLLFVLTACSNVDNSQKEVTKVKSITIQEMISFKEAKRNSTKKISNIDDVKKIVDAFSHAFQEPGIVDMADPEYKVKIGKKSYYLWFSADGASAAIMNVEDTHTIYTMASTEDIYTIIHAKLE